MAEYRERAVIEAIQVDRYNYEEICKLLGVDHLDRAYKLAIGYGGIPSKRLDGIIVDTTKDGKTLASVGDFILKNDSEVSVLDKETFEKTYFKID